MNYRSFLFLSILAFTLSAQAQEDNDGRNTQAAKPKSTTETISFDVGPAWITSKMYTPSGEYTWKRGLEVGFEFSRVYSKGYGFGISILHNSTSYPEGKVRLSYVGPSFVYAGFLSDKWRGMAEIGLGFSIFHDEGSGNESGLGIKYSTGLEYMLSKDFGISAKLRSVTVYFGGKQKDFGGDDDEINGVARVALLLGACFRF